MSQVKIISKKKKINWYKYKIYILVLVNLYYQYVLIYRTEKCSIYFIEADNSQLWLILIYRVQEQSYL